MGELKVWKGTIVMGIIALLSVIAGVFIGLAFNNVEIVQNVTTVTVPELHIEYIELNNTDCEPCRCGNVTLEVKTITPTMLEEEEESCKGRDCEVCQDCNGQLSFERKCYNNPYLLESGVDDIRWGEIVRDWMDDKNLWLMDHCKRCEGDVWCVPEEGNRIFTPWGK